MELSNGFYFDAHINLFFGAVNVKIQDWNKDMGPKGVQEALVLAPILIPGHVEISPHEESRVPAQIHRHVLSGQLSQIIRNVLLALSGAPHEQAETKDQYTFDFVARAIDRHFGVSLQRLPFNPDKDLEIRAPYREQDCELDIVSAGSGLHQILKLAAFIAWRKSRVVLLDEPDAHLHTSLQVQLASFLQELGAGLGTQIILATHSRDLISQAPMESIIPVDTLQRHLRPMQNIEHLLREYQRLGPISNIDLALLYQTKRCLFVEGPSDLQLLPLIAAQLGFGIFTGPNQFVVFPFKGAEKFTMVKDLVELFEKMVGAAIRWFVLRDKDASTRRVLDYWRNQAQQKGIANYHIWERHSLENYLLAPSVVTMAVEAAATLRGINPPSSQEVEALLADVCEAVRREVRPSFVTWVQDYYRHHDLGNGELAAEEALNELESATDLAGNLKVLPGSKVFGQFVQALQNGCGLTVRTQDLVGQLDAASAPQELREFFERLTNL